MAGCRRRAVGALSFGSRDVGPTSTSSLSSPSWWASSSPSPPRRCPPPRPSSGRNPLPLPPRPPSGSPQTLVRAFSTVSPFLSSWCSLSRLRLFSPISPSPWHQPSVESFSPGSSPRPWSPFGVRPSAPGHGFAPQPLGRTPLPGFPSSSGFWSGPSLQCSLGRWEKERRGFWSRFDPERLRSTRLPFGLSQKPLLPILCFSPLGSHQPTESPRERQAARMERLSEEISRSPEGWSGVRTTSSTSPG